MLLRFTPAGKAVPVFDRARLALVLTVQVASAQSSVSQRSVFGVGVIFRVLPWIGLELLETARGVAAFDLPMPMRVLVLWWGSP